MKQVRIKINDLIDRHGGTFITCEGCSICTEIDGLQSSLVRDPLEQFQPILDKGQDMTRSDIELLLEHQVQRRVIKKHLGMGDQHFFELLRNFGLLKKKPKGDDEMARGKLNLTVDEFIQLKHIEKLSIMKIAEMKGVSDPTIHHWMKKHKAEIGNALNGLKNAPQVHSEAKEVSESARKVEADAGESLALKAELESKDSRIEELEGLLAEAESKIDHLTGCCDDLESEIGQLRNAPSLSVDYVQALQERVADLETQLAPIRQLAYLKLKQDLA
ncbi:hypothetical protein [Mesobacillus sp. S13]|uniref:hypothetical protein n=1 Tax=Mesobacillus sp. S13 TaxID=2880221 RepID=UPI001CF1B545|nr:hypothetical protein [Mesobacillus sp. S13]